MHPVRDLPRRWVALAAAVGATLGYTLAVDPVIYSPGQVLYPLVWIAASAVALWLARPRPSAVGPLAGLAGAGYAVALLWTAGLLGSGSGPVALSAHLGVPGWGPAVVYDGAVLRLTLVPFLLVGYATLGLLAATAIDRISGAGTATAGLVGLLACVGCTAPLLAGLATSLGAGSIAATLSGAAYPLATAAFLLSAGTFVVLARRGTA